MALLALPLSLPPFGAISCFDIVVFLFLLLSNAAADLRPCPRLSTVRCSCRCRVRAHDISRLMLRPPGNKHYPMTAATYLPTAARASAERAAGRGGRMEMELNSPKSKAPKKTSYRLTLKHECPVSGSLSSPRLEHPPSKSTKVCDVSIHQPLCGKGKLKK